MIQLNIHRKTNRIQGVTKVTIGNLVISCYFDQLSYQTVLARRRIHAPSASFQAGRRYWRWRCSHEPWFNGMIRTSTPESLGLFGAMKIGRGSSSLQSFLESMAWKAWLLESGDSPPNIARGSMPVCFLTSTVVETMFRIGPLESPFLHGHKLYDAITIKSPDLLQPIPHLSSQNHHIFCHQLAHQGPNPSYS